MRTEVDLNAIQICRRHVKILKQSDIQVIDKIELTATKLIIVNKRSVCKMNRERRLLPRFSAKIWTDGLKMLDRFTGEIVKSVRT